ncbi:Flavohemoprotein [gamma proteobacterium IMCC2047]|nr:Flavohemoprotein [gamma proteobacterium IMCC2047]
MHDQVKVGDNLNISAPCGEFHLKDSAKPAILVSGGVGITPMQSMLETLIARDPERDVHFVHGTENGGHHSFSHRLQQLSREGKVIPHIFYANASEADRAEQRFQYEGQTDLTAIEAELPIDEAEFYLCGPLAMMKAMYLQLKMLKVPDTNIFYEVFGPTKSLAD